MNLSRRDWMKFTGGAALAATLPRSLSALPYDAPANVQPVLRDYEKPMFNLPGQFSTPVKVKSIEMLQKGRGGFFVRTTSTDGAVGIVGTKQVEDFMPIFTNLVAPHFIGKDAREIETLVDSVYVANYKIAGLPFWCPVAYCEQSILDLLGKVANKPVGALLGGVIRKEIPVYLSGSARVLSAEEEVEVYVRGIASTGATAVKFHIGGRMSKNLDVYPGRTERIMRLAREKFPARTAIMIDPNGSYDVENGIRIGKLAESLDYYFYEEPCPYENLDENIAVAKALKIPMAFGEQNYSLWQFDWMMRNGLMKIVQPDINYNGGLIRALRVARLAEKQGKTIVPHNTQTGVTSANIVQFASCVRNPGEYMEYPWRQPQQTPSWYKPDFKIVNGKIRVPETPGMGLEIDPDYLKDATVVARIDKPARRTGEG